jgi:aspartate kinase
MYPEHQERSAAEGDLSPVELGVNFADETSASSVCAPSQQLIALKFGGTLLLGAERMRHAAGLVREAARHCAVTVVVSAMKGITDQLLGIARLLEQGERQIARNEAQSVINSHLATLRDFELPEHQHDRLRNEIKSLGRDLLHEVREHLRVVVDAALHDRLASFGERLSARLFAAALSNAGVAAVPVASSDFVLTCDNFRDAKPQLERTCRRGRDILLPLLESGIVPVVTGFIGATQDGCITTMGRNSSDFSAAIIACADGQRCSGALASAVRITCSRPGGKPGRSVDGRGGGASTCLRSRSNSESPWNGLVAVAHSNRITPIA